MNGGEDGRYFLDTNILIYSLAVDEPRKQPIAQALVQAALATRRGVLSTQVVQEFLNIALRHGKPVFSSLEATDYLNKVLWPLCHHFPSKALYERAIEVKGATGFTFYDSLIVAAAIQLDCQRLITEDLQHGRVVQGVRIVNPFAETTADD